MWGGKEDERRRLDTLEGSGGMLPQNFFKLKSPEMPFLEAISSSYLILLMIVQRYSYHTTPQRFKYVFWFLVFCNGVFFWLGCGGGGGGAAAPFARPPLLPTAIEFSSHQPPLQGPPC